MLLALIVIAIGFGTTLFIASSKAELIDYLNFIKLDWDTESCEDLDQLIHMVDTSYTNRTLQFFRAGAITAIVGVLDIVIRRQFSLPHSWMEAFLQCGHGCILGIFLFSLLSAVFTLWNRGERDQLLRQFRVRIWNNPSLFRSYDQLIGRAPAINDLLREFNPLTYMHHR